jgi:NAD+ synthase (glutamine-hydrolysing)
MHEPLIIAGASVNQIPLHWENNTSNIIEAIEQAKINNVRLLCLPELCVTGYGCEDWFLSDWVAARAEDEVRKIAGHCQNITVSVGLPIIYKNVPYNGACVISNQRILGITCKQFLARDGVHYEPRWFNPWPPNNIVELKFADSYIPVGDVVYEIDGIKLGFEICEDAWHKGHRPGYRLKERNINLIFNPSASHFAMGKSQIREQELVIDGSQKFECAYVFANLLGNEAGRMIYDGDIIIAQFGKLLAVNNRLSFKNYNLLMCRVDFKEPEKSEQIKSTDSKDKNEELTKALSLGLFDYLRKSKAKGFVLSLSGGADSSSIAVFVAEMVRRAAADLGWEKFYQLLNLKPTTEEQFSKKDAMKQLLVCAYQGTTNSSTETFNAARTLAESIGATFHAWKIDEEVNSYSTKIETAIQRKLTWETDDIALQNIQARSRSPIIWMLANIHKAVLLTTSNRSEGDVGYATMDGDTSGSLAPIAGISKPFILQWLKWAEKELGYTGLAPVNNLQPTAELRPLERHQTDENDLMPYLILEEIERHAIFFRKSPVSVYDSMKGTVEKSLLKNYIRKFFRLWATNQWKRERLAPSFHLDDLNVDPRTWCRFPILSSSFEEELIELDKI